MKPFDDQFADNLRETFDSWDEPVDEQAWQQMKGRLQPSGRKGFYIVPLWIKVAAAVFVLGVLGFSSWLLFYPSPNDYQMAESALSPDASEQPLRTLADDNQDIQNQGLLSPLANTPDVDSPGSTVSQMVSLPTQETRQTYPSDNQAEAGPEEHTTAQNDPNVVPPVDMPAQQIEVADIAPVETSSGGDGTVQGMAGQHGLDDEQIIRENLALLDEENRSHRQPSFVELSAGTMKTISGSEVMGGIGLAAGAGMQWPLGRRFSIGSGGALVYNQFSIDQAGFLSAGRYYDAVAVLPDFEGAQHVEILEREINTDYEFIALDIPLNLRYTILQMRRGSIYASAGISSLLYLQQSYQTQTDVMAEVSGLTAQGSTFLNTSSISTVQSDDFGVFSRLDFARFLNFSAGYVITGNSQSLVIEPYLKLPLGGITSLNFQIGMAGISLKYRPVFR